MTGDTSHRACILPAMQIRTLEDTAIPRALALRVLAEPLIVHHCESEYPESWSGIARYSAAVVMM